MNNLVIVESPTKSKTISKFLDKSFNVRASVGHIRDLPKSDKDAIDIDGGFIPRYEVSEGKEAGLLIEADLPVVKGDKLVFGNKEGI